MVHPYNWQPVRHSVFQDEAHAETLHHEGITVQPFLSPDQIQALKDIYHRYHSLSDDNGGMFYSVYSQDLAYRQQVDAEIRAVLQPVLDSWFKGYKNVINSFVVKLPGKASEFAIHQDTTALDETRFSPLSIWIPLQDITEANGALCVVPRTQGLFSPYRGISWPFPFQRGNNQIRDFLEPVSLKTGEAILFDPRILHNSLPNSTDAPRIALICGIFPEEADFNICFKEPDGEIDVYRQDDDFLLKYPNFLHHCHDRPVAGEIVRQVPDKYPSLSGEEVEKLLLDSGLEKRNLLPPVSELNCNMISEPDNVDRAPLVPYEEVEADPTPEPVLAEGGERKGGFWSRLFGRKA